MSDKDQDRTDEKSPLTKDNLDTSKTADGTIPDGQTPAVDEQDETKVKFFGNGGASGDEEAKVDMPVSGIEEGKTTNEFTGLTKDELMTFSNDPFWVKVRWVLLILFWVAWFGMLAAAIIIIVLAPKCPPRPPMEWYQKSVAYNVHPRSFKDSNEDGVGDLKGIHENLDHLKAIDAKTLWINSILKSSRNFGYDVVDYKDIGSDYGTMQEFESMRVSAHKKGRKIIMDFVPNHSSVNHTWFIESSKSKNNDYSDYYIWRDPDTSGSTPTAPNNWKSIYGGSAWTYSPSRNQYYLHQYMEGQPDLNLRNPKVKEEIKNAIRFWFDKGVDGLNLVGAPYLFEAINITGNNEPAAANPPQGANDYYTLNHTLTKYQPETFDIIAEWRAIADAVKQDTDKPRALIVEGDDSGAPAHFLEHNGKHGAHMVVDPALTKLDGTFNNQKVLDLIKNHLDKWPSSITTMWMVGNADVKRVASRVHHDNINAVQMLLMTLPGTPTTYYGEEIAMTNTRITSAENKDPLGEGDVSLSRDGQRTPMQWSNKPMAGFTDGTKSWLPINPNYTTVNLKSATAAGAGHSHYESYVELSKLRNKESLLWGELGLLEMTSGVVAFTRQANGFNGYLIVINFDLNTNPTLDFYSSNKDKVAKTGKVVANTGNFGKHDDFTVNATVNLDNVILRGGQGVVFEWPFSEVKK